MLWFNPSAEIYKNKWTNFGGDKLWPAPQSIWGWPPDPDLDGSPHDYVATKKSFTVLSPVSLRFGIRFERTVTLAPKGSLVKVVNRMINASNKDVELSVWQVTQVDNPDFAILPVEKTSQFPKGFASYDDMQGDPAMEKVFGTYVELRRADGKDAKYGAGSRAGYVGAVKGNYRFTMRTPYVPGSRYPDNGRAQQIFLNKGPEKYVELELVSPIQRISPGASISMAVEWEIQKTAPGKKR